MASIVILMTSLCQLNDVAWLGSQEYACFFGFIPGEVDAALSCTAVAGLKAKRYQPARVASCGADLQQAVGKPVKELGARSWGVKTCGFAP